MPLRVGVLGAGWAGLAAAVEACRLGHAVTLFEMAAEPGGRARAVRHGAQVLDNGQHILIGAYQQTLQLMRTVGVTEESTLLRLPLRLVRADGRGLRLRAGPAIPAFAAAVLGRRDWSLAERIALLTAAAGWALGGFRCDPNATVADLCTMLAQALRSDLIDPLCVAALNTPAEEASGTVFLRVLRDALFAGRGAADLLLPKVDLSALFPTPALAWLAAQGASLKLRHRVRHLAAQGEAWTVDEEPFDRVVLALPPGEAARLAEPIAATWARTAAALRFEPIATVYLQADGARLAEPMLALQSGPQAPAQFVFDRGQLGGEPGLLAFVVSGAQPWVDRGLDQLQAATLGQACSELGLSTPGRPQPLRTLVEKRATFRCTPGLSRPPMLIAPGLAAAGDYVAGPYPATLEGAVRSGLAAVAALTAAQTAPPAARR